MWFLVRLWNSLSSRRLNRQLSQQLETHFGMLEQDARRAGLTVEQARRSPRRPF
jgi:hypothetical protein